MEADDVGAGVSLVLRPIEPAAQLESVEALEIDEFGFDQASEANSSVRAVGDLRKLVEIPCQLAERSQFGLNFLLKARLVRQFGSEIASA